MDTPLLCDDRTRSTVPTQQEQPAARKATKTASDHKGDHKTRIEPAVVANLPDTPPERAAAMISLLLKVRPATSSVEGPTNEERLQALDQAAWTWGARYGLFWRTAMIDKRLERLQTPMASFAFDAVILDGRGRRILPPVIAVTRDAFHLDDNGQRLARARETLRILSPARLVTTTPSWRSWLKNDGIKKPPNPPAAVFPKNASEQRRWARALREGFASGVAQADGMFADRLDRLVTDFTGMVAWHVLRLQSKVSDPIVIDSDMVVNGGGNKMSIETRLSEIRSPSKLNPVWSDWMPIVTEEKHQ